MLFKYMPPGEIVRLYIEGPRGVIPLDADQDAIWASYKLTSLHIDPGWEQFRWESPEEEIEAKRKFFSGWGDPRCWSGPATVFFDSLY